MNATAEISMYPMREDFIPPIDAGIEKLNSFGNVSVETVATATIRIDDYDSVTNAIKETIAWSYTQFGTSVFAIKLIPGYEPA